MAFHRWQERTRDDLSELLPGSTVVLPLGAVEQHGPHLPTGTDAIIVAEVAAACAAQAGASGRDIVLAPLLGVGVSAHHREFGGTLSLRPSTHLLVLEDILRSIADAGGRRVVILNAHGGNRGTAAAAAEAAAAATGLHVAHLDYWTVLDTASQDVSVPGHAGRFETSLMAHLRPELVQTSPHRDSSPRIGTAPMVVYSQQIWAAIDGFTDRPHCFSSADGGSSFALCVDRIAGLIVDFHDGFRV